MRTTLDISLSQDNHADAARLSSEIAAALNGQPAGEVIPFKKP